APMAVAAGAGAAAAGAGEAAEEKTEFDVVIKDVGPKKIDVIKAIRQLTTLGLKDAKDLAETPDAKVLEAVGQDAAEDAKSKLEEAGASVELA
ncbi:MAG: 50S ribosomal protein L7/L12, partial [Anaerolineales bacterium]|nr:50S ribosomal protein L7/L12 [Anaerolineales bacterium]